MSFGGGAIFYGAKDDGIEQTSVARVEIHHGVRIAPHQSLNQLAILFFGGV